jgi:hypothetical protein
MYADSNPALLQGTVREFCLVCQGKSKDIEGDGTSICYCAVFWHYQGFAIKLINPLFCK